MESNEISSELFGLLNGKNLEGKQHEAMILQTVTEDDWPHTAMISVGEILGLDRKNLRLSLWPGTTTTQNILRSGHATLVAVYHGKVHYVRLSLQALPDLEHPKHNLVRFTATVASAREDEAKYAKITSGIHIQLIDPEDVIKRWYETINVLML